MKKWLTLILCLAAPLVTGFLGSLVTTPSIQNWYYDLNKPPFSPPNWLFAPVWTSLYLMMGLASFLIAQQKKSAVKVRSWLKLYSFHLIINWLWSFVFFGLHQPFWAVAVIMILWMMIFSLMKQAHRLKQQAAWLLYPYLAWVSFATVLNISLAILN